MHPTRVGAARLCAVTLLILMFGLTGCPKDPYDPDTWIDKLDDRDPREVERAVTELQRLKHPKAIKPLANTWRKQSKSSKILKVIIELAANTENDGPHWDLAIDVLVEAVEDYDVGDSRSIENAIAAADALGRAKNTDAIQPLINAVNQKLRSKDHPGQRVRLSAIRALGQFGNNSRAVDTLINTLDADPELERIEIFGAAVNALADARSTKAIIPLMMTMNKKPGLFQQVRRALIAIGPEVIPELHKTLKGEHKELNDLAKQLKLNVKCPKRNGTEAERQIPVGPESQCRGPAQLEYFAAQLLGDLYAGDKTSLELLRAELKKEPMPAFFTPAGDGPSSHEAALIALRRIRPTDDDTIKAVKDYWVAKSTFDSIRPMAMDVYSYIAKEDKDALQKLGEYIIDGDNEPQMRMAAGAAYARLVYSADQFSIAVPKIYKPAERKKRSQPIQYMIDHNKEKADALEKKVTPLQDKYDELKKDFDKKTVAYKGTKGADADKLGKELTALKEKIDKLGAEKSPLEGNLKYYTDLYQNFEQHLARAEIGINCGSKLDCYMDIIDKKGEDIVKGLKLVKAPKEGWTKDQYDVFKIVASERALLELMKMREKVRPQFDKILEMAETTERVMRESILMIMVHSAELPCKKCVERLDAIIEDQQDNSTLRQLTMDAQAVRNYFLWAGEPQ